MDWGLTSGVLVIQSCCIFLKIRKYGTGYAHGDAEPARGRRAAPPVKQYRS
jgi:hypothetical protein